MAVERIKDGSVIQIWSARCPQGFQFRCHGELKRELVDMEGIALVRYRGVKADEKKDTQTPSDDF